MSKNALSAFLSVLALVSAVENISQAQDVRATMGGRVTDALGAVVPGVSGPFRRRASRNRRRGKELHWPRTAEAAPPG